MSPSAHVQEKAARLLRDGRVVVSCDDDGITARVEGDHDSCKRRSKLAARLRTTATSAGISSTKPRIRSESTAGLWVRSRPEDQDRRSDPWRRVRDGDRVNLLGVGQEGFASAVLRLHVLVVLSHEELVGWLRLHGSVLRIGPRLADEETFDEEALAELEWELGTS
jgi:hypothetical protein